MNGVVGRIREGSKLDESRQTASGRCRRSVRPLLLLKTIMEGFNLFSAHKTYFEEERLTGEVSKQKEI